MARSAHAYVRGKTADFYDWLRHLKRGHLPEGPPVWICGDCHVGNLGPLAHSDGRVEIQIRDHRVLELLQLYASFLKIAGADAVHSKGFDVCPSGDDRLDCLVRSAKHATSSTHLRSAGRCGLRFWRTASGGAIGPRTS